MTSDMCELCRPERVLLEGALAYVRYDSSSLSRGHVLIVPRRHVAGYFDMTLEEKAEIQSLLDRAKARIESEHSPDGYNVGVNVGKAAGQNRMHVHLHLIPRYRGDVPDPSGGIRCVLSKKSPERPDDSSRDRDPARFSGQEGSAMKLGLEGKTALVTAASGGIGSGIAEALADAGVHVAIGGRNADALNRLADRLAERPGGRPAIVIGDVCRKDGPARIASDALAALGGSVDILVNNAGGARPFAGDADDAAWDEAFTLNFLAARRLTDLIVPGMKARNWGRVVNISGALVAPRLNGAAPAKAALVSWSRTLSSELGAHGITVNTVAPGRINSAQIARLHPTEQSKADFIKQNIPAGYFGEPHDIGHLVAFLASPLARYINGAAIPVDGGAVRRI